MFNDKKEYTDSLKKFHETSLPKKENFYSNLDMEDITDANYKHAKKEWKNFEIKSLREYHNLYLQSDTLFLGYVFENFHNKCTELDPACFLSALELAWQA